MTATETETVVPESVVKTVTEAVAELQWWADTLSAAEDEATLELSERLRETARKLFAVV